jgi:hypothetical protein
VRGGLPIAFTPGEWLTSPGTFLFPFDACLRCCSLTTRVLTTHNQAPRAAAARWKVDRKGRNNRRKRDRGATEHRKRKSITAGRLLTPSLASIPVFLHAHPPPTSRSPTPPSISFCFVCFIADQQRSLTEAQFSANLKKGCKRKRCPAVPRSILSSLTLAKERATLCKTKMHTHLSLFFVPRVWWSCFSPPPPPSFSPPHHQQSSARRRGKAPPKIVVRENQRPGT